MPPLLLLVACCVLIAVLTVSYLWSRNKGTSDAPPDRRTSTIPGPAPKDKETGNLSEIGAAGSLHHFLSGQHMRYGPVVGFWIGKLYVVSVASPNGFKKLVHVFNRPPELFQLFEPLITNQSIQYANYEDGRGRRQLYDRAFSHGSLSQYYQAFQQITDELVAKWSRADKDDHLPLHQSMIDLAIKAIALTAFGESLRDDRLLAKLQKSYEVCWETMEHSLAHGFPEQGSDNYKQFEDGKEAMYNVLMDILGKKRNDTTVNTEPKIFFDYLLEYDDSEKRIFADGISYMIGGFHTTGNMLTWALYYLSRDKAVQDKLADEIKVVLGDQNVNETNIADLKFLRQVQEETLRCSVLAPWGAKFLDEDFEIEGHIIPAKTPIITSLGVMLKDPNYWPDPESGDLGGGQESCPNSSLSAVMNSDGRERTMRCRGVCRLGITTLQKWRFDPDRFSAENSKNRPAHVFSPFGLAGKRICPGYRFAFSETAVVLATLVRKFRLHMMNEHDVKPVFGLVTSVSEEVWVSLSPR